ncbi:MAG: hypothetical protein HFJ35_03100 [Clostridia bacterium]|nr:hypothetical protein [Clostridia bacterium]
MPNINTKELEMKWNKSINKIHQLLEKKDISTANMIKFYKLYINAPYNRTALDLFELAFNGWYKEKMEG